MICDLPAAEGDFITSKMDVFIRKDLRNLSHERFEKGIGRVQCGVNWSELTVRLPLFVITFSQQVWLTRAPGLRMTWETKLINPINSVNGPHWVKGNRMLFTWSIKFRYHSNASKTSVLNDLFDVLLSIHMGVGIICTLKGTEKRSTDELALISALSSSIHYLPLNKWMEDLLICFSVFFWSDYQSRQ